MAGLDEDVEFGSIESEEKIDLKDVSPDGRPKRVRKLTKKGLGLIISDKMLQFKHLSTQVTREIIAATEELRKEDRIREVLLHHREQISSKFASLSKCESDLQELESNETVAVSLAETQAAVFNAISQLVTATAEKADSMRSRCSRPAHSQTSKHSKAASRVHTRSDVNSSRSNTSVKILAKATAAALVARAKGQSLAHEMYREIEAADEEERAEQAKEERKKRERQRQLAELELRTQIAEQKATIDVLESYEQSSNPPELPLLSLLDYQPGGPLAYPKFANPVVSHESARQYVSYMTTSPLDTRADQHTTSAGTGPSTAALVSTGARTTTAAPSAVPTSSTDGLVSSSAAPAVAFMSPSFSDSQGAVFSAVTTSLPRTVYGSSVGPAVVSTTFNVTAGAAYSSSAAVQATASMHQPIMSTLPFLSSGERRHIDEPSTHPSTSRVGLFRSAPTDSGVVMGADRFSIYGQQLPGHKDANGLRSGIPSDSFVLDPRLRPQANLFTPGVPGLNRHVSPESLRIGGPRAASTGVDFTAVPMSDSHVHVGSLSSPQPSLFHSSTLLHDSYLESVTKTLADALTLNRLPLQEPCIFSGDPLLYPTWKSSFSFLIERQNIHASEKLLYLQRYVSGPAKEAVSGFFLLRDTRAYEQAMTVLEQRFGNSYVISTAFRTKLDEWPIVKNKDGVALRCLSDFLQQCAIAAKEVGGLEILNDAHYLKRIVEKLPDWMTHRWSRSVVNTKLYKKRYPTFEELVTFVTLEAEITNDPVFGIATPATSSAAKPVLRMSAPPSKKVSLVTTSESMEATCDFCGYTKHGIAECRSFQKKPIKERRDFVLKKGLCFGCLLTTEHRSRQCSQRVTCTTCGKKHPTCLHDNDFVSTFVARRGNGGNSRQSTAVNVSGHQTSSNPVVVATSHRSQSDGDSSLTAMIVPVYMSCIDNPEKEVLTYALLDTMSDATFAVTTVVENVGASSREATLKLTTLTDNDALVPCRKYSGLRVRSIFSSEWVSLPPAYSREFLTLHTSHIPTPDTVAEHPHLRRLSSSLSPLLPDCVAGLLIGFDCPEALMPISVIPGLPYGVETKLGWSVVGKSSQPVAFDAVGSSHHVALQQTSREDERVAFVYRSHVEEASATDLLHALERDFVDVESGVMSQDDMKFLKIVEDNVLINEAGHYEMPLPFRPESPSLPDNRNVAMKRVLGLKRQFERRPDYFSDYVKFMNVILDRGDAERVPEEEVESSTRWYIPHHGVYNPKKPGKIRVVFDCSARHLGTCLNDLLLQGPDLISSLVGVLCRFRKGPIAFACDIEKMYHQFHVTKPHRDYLRFLWWENGDVSKPLVDYRMKVHIFGATSSPGCANFGLKQVAKDNAAVCPDASAFLQRDFYVDDGLKAKDTVKEAVEVLTKAREICSRGNLRLHKIVSNSEEMLSHFPDSEVSSSKSTDLSAPSHIPAVERTLGLQWNTDNDTLGFNSDLKSSSFSRRGVLSTVASLYDPLGFLAPFVLLGKLILQEMCRDHLGWDDPLPERLEVRWSSWLADLLNIGLIQIPRNYLPLDFGSVVAVELHHFSDASTIGYGQCSYLRFMDSGNNVHCTLVMAKGRVTPLRPVTVPRLELQAAVLSVKIARFLQEELDYDDIQHFFWTDSQIVLAYLHNETKRFHIFVANRVHEILQFEKASQWNYVASEENPADHASRGLTVDGIVSSSWLLGPEFLLQPQVYCKAEYFEIPEHDVEVKVCKATDTTEVSFTSFDERAKRFSDKSSLLRGIAVIIRRCSAKKGATLSKLESYRIAEKKWIACVQREELSRPSASLRNSLKQLNCFTGEDGVLRVGGRLGKSSEDYECKYPAVLPRDSHFSLLIARKCHHKVAHQGRTTTINEIRATGYWILGIRHIVSSIIRCCVACLRLRGQPQGQMMSDLPVDRVEASAPFTYCGLDCFGPFYVKDGRKETKRYGLIITCLSSRAVHIEVLDDMSTDSFINGLRNVIAIRGSIRLIRCDRGTNFVGACNELKLAWKEMNSDIVIERMLEENCEFKFNPPASSHMGGVWERQIRTIRSVLNGLLQKSGHRLTTSSLRTFLYEAMAIINSRPLAVESLESPDGPRPLTPNHILTMKHSGILPPPGVFEDADLYVRKRWRCVQRLAEEFWQSWRKEYLTTLQQRRKWQRPQQNVIVGDVVVLHDLNVCRNDWKMARVTEVFPSDDGLVRSVRLLMSTSTLDKHGRPTTAPVCLIRPVHKLSVLVSMVD